jgi:hypothetical protein
MKIIAILIRAGKRGIEVHLLFHTSISMQIKGDQKTGANR